ncbi:TIGR04255 family protein [Halomonas sp. GT]|uniref:TIGR04255 family protein n=1 Tax=Halomonas sp. GT TaxID=1971364 RepID=UPI0009F397A2|nr:TIGR04255 family protein [Halomonas sp. GT]
MKDRPKNLPEFSNPPLDEVVIGVQFSALPGYSSVLAKDVWGLYKDDFPLIQEHPPIEPTFETFGGMGPQQSVQFRFGPSQLNPRLWFISQDQNHLIQFQEDRFLLNWRKQANGNQYPRFEGVSENFESNLLKLEALSFNGQKNALDINQAEVSYINFIQAEDYSKINSWIKTLDFSGINVESMNINFTEVVNDINKKPVARLFHELQPVVTKNGKVKAVRLILTYRGQPAGNSVAYAMNFIRQGREKIVNRFSEMTTKEAHKVWGEIL